MANRFQSIVDGISERTLKELAELYPKLTTGAHWYIRDGKLCAQIMNDDAEFVFEHGDPDSEAFLLLLNHLPGIIQSFTTVRP